jgi:hypothetical protein
LTNQMSFFRLAVIYCSLFNCFAVKFTEKMTARNDEDSKKMATNVFLEVNLFVFNR